MNRFIKFAMVGGMGTIVNLVVFAALQYRAGAGYIASSVAAFVVAASFNYALNRAWVFADRGKKRGPMLYLKFMCVSAIALGVNVGVLWLSETYLMPALFDIGFFNWIFVQTAWILNVKSVGKITSLYSQALGIAIAMAVNFVGNNLITFRRASKRA